MIQKLLIISILLFKVIYSTEYQGANIIPYQSGNKLKWNDFIEVKSLGDAAAESSTSISYDYYENNGSVKVKVYCLFDKSHSFVLKGKRTDYILNHEQGHFDITYLFAMKFKQELSRTSDLSEGNVYSIYLRVIKQWDLFQEQYDLETDHSINVNGQRIWDVHLYKSLENLTNH